MPDNEAPEGARRYLKSREKPWAHALARWAKGVGLTPNAISVLSLVFAVVSAYCMMNASDAPSKVLVCVLWIGGAAGIQLRLLCNLIDGLVAIEGGMKSPVGGLYNEVPDRFADAILLMAAGYSNDWVVKLWVGFSGVHLSDMSSIAEHSGQWWDKSWGIPMGWVAAVLAVMLAYIRVLGGTLVGTQSFIGPMAKQHRMFMLTLACLGAMVEQCCRADGKVERVMQVALGLIVAGSLVTCWRRLALISKQLRQSVQK